jgi:hypothetical protein
MLWQVSVMRRALSHAAFGLFAVAMLSGCGSAEDRPGFDAGANDGGPVATPVLEVGTGKDNFVTLRETDTIEIIHGPQGGWHLWGALRTKGLTPPLTVDYAISLPETQTELSRTVYDVDPLAVGNWSIWAGLIGYLPEPSLAAEKSVLLTMQVTDANGVSLRSSARAVAGPLPSCPTEPMPGNTCAGSP